MFGLVHSCLVWFVIVSAGDTLRLWGFWFMFGLDWELDGWVW